jgi:hypothetical protein
MAVYGFIDWELIESLGLILIIISLIGYIIGVLKRKAPSGGAAPGGGGGGGTTPPRPGDDKYNDVQARVFDDVTKHILPVRAKVEIRKTFGWKLFGETKLADGMTDPVRMSKGNKKFQVSAPGFTTKQVKIAVPGGGGSFVFDVYLQGTGSGFNLTRTDPQRVRQGSSVTNWNFEGNGLMATADVAFPPEAVDLITGGRVNFRAASNSELFIPDEMRIPANNDAAAVTRDIKFTDNLGKNAIIQIEIEPMPMPLIKEVKPEANGTFTLEWELP